MHGKIRACGQWFFFSWLFIALSMACFFPSLARAQNVRTVAILSHTDGLGAEERALTVGLNTIIAFKLESAQGIRVTPDAELDTARDALNPEMLWKNSGASVRKAADALQIDVIITGRHRTSGDSISAAFHVCDASRSKVTCTNIDKKLTRNSTAQFQKTLAEAVGDAVGKNLGSGMRALPYTNERRALDAFFKGVDLLNHGRDADAFKSFKSAEKVDPKFRDLWYFMGKYYTTQQFDYEKAIGYLNRVINRNPNDPAAYFRLGFAYYLQGATMPAIRAFETTTRLKPVVFDAYVYLAMLYKDLGQYDKVESYYRKTLAYTPNNAAIWYNLAGIQAQMKKGSESAASLRQALSLNCTVFLDIVRTDSDFSAVRKTPAFQQVIQEFMKKCGR